MSQLIRSMCLAVGLAAWPTAAFAADKNWAVEYDSSFEGTNNLQQQAGGTPDLAWRNYIGLSYYPLLDNDNSALFQLQVLNSLYRYNPDYDSTFVIANAVTSHRFVESCYGYGGAQVIFKQSNAATGSDARDNDFFLGAVVYRPITPALLVFHGYQFDYLRAGVDETSYQGHSIYVTLRHLTLDRWINTVSLRSQVRNYDMAGALEWRNFLTVDSDYHLLSWLTLSGEVVFFTSQDSRPDYTFNGYNFGLFSRFSL